jgi:radical SAM protein with 4Fe4S-binding SPASM domain
MTNGINLLKYYDMLPIGRFEEVHVSLDGLSETHLGRRFSDATVTDKAVYDNIVAGIKKLLDDDVAVVIKSTVDRNSYLEYPDFRDFLLNKGILNSPHCKHSVSNVTNFENPLDADERFNDKDDLPKMWEYMINCGLPPRPPFAGLSTLWSMIARANNEPFKPSHNRCDTRFMANYQFTPDGDVYFCECFHKGKGIVGTYYPEVSLNEDVIKKLAFRSVVTNKKCTRCPYKFICLGNCPKSAEAKGEEMTCGVFLNDEIMNNLEYNYFGRKEV